MCLSLFTTTADWCSVGKVTTIDTLDDHALLQIFSCSRHLTSSHLLWWKPLVHVCHRWRQLIFTSPRTLRLAVVCSPKTPVRKYLCIWPPFPISIRHDTWDPDRNNENTIAALKHRDRVSEISINCLRKSVLETLAAEMLEPFPALSSLYLGYSGNAAPVLPETVFGGFAGTLQSIVLAGVAFPALPILLSSAIQLTSLQLWKTPTTGYISPKAMATCLAALPNLEDLRIEFRSCYDHMSSPSPTRSILPSLTCFHFKGISEYSENLVAQIDAPILQTLSISFCDVAPGVPQLYQFLGSTEKPGPPNRVVMEFDFWRVDLKFMPSNNFELAMRCENLAGQVGSMAAVCRDLSPILSRVECLDLNGKRLPSYPTRRDDTIPTSLQWQMLLYPFINVRSLNISKKLEPLVMPALEELARGRVAAVFPKLSTLFLEEVQPPGSARDAIEAFVSAREFSKNPVAIQFRLPLDSNAGTTLSPCSSTGWFWNSPVDN